ncbi:MAG: STAS domain-containing protein [Desulfovibrionaceae bacterium]|nr:STAS domain-containing protein [Desulfovibrionaceae bacterium]
MKNAFKSEILAGLFKTVEAKTAHGHEPMTVQNAFRGKVVAVHYAGVLSQTAMSHFKPMLFEIVTGKAQQIIIDMEDVHGVSQSTLGVLVDFAAGVLGRGKKIYLYTPPADLLKIMDAMELREFFDILHTEEDIINILPEG